MSRNRKDDLAAAKDSYYYRHIDFAKITAA